jgi:hypothetical protein
MNKKNDDNTIEAHQVIHKTGYYEWRRPLTAQERADLLGLAQTKKASSRRLAALSEDYKGKAKESKEDSETARRDAYHALDKLEDGNTVEIIHECQLDLDYTDGLATYSHPVTGELLHTREMSKEERQMSFDFGQPEMIPPAPLGEVLEFPAGH